MNYKILILVALVASVLLSGCINPIDNTGNFTKTPTYNDPLYQSSTSELHKIDLVSNPGYFNEVHRDAYVFRTTQYGSGYTCFYIESNGMQANPALSCTRDIQAVY